MPAGFFRVDNPGAEDEVLIRAGKFVYGPGYSLLAEDKDTYTYPTEGGWYWFEDKEEALQFFDLPEDVTYLE